MLFINWMLRQCTTVCSLIYMYDRSDFQLHLKMKIKSSEK